MNNLIIPPTGFTPGVNFRLDKAYFEISGVSRPEDVIVFYDEPIAWLRELEKEIFRNPDIKRDLSSIKLVFKMSYYNSSSSKYLIQILKQFKTLEESGLNLFIYWHYEEGDERMREDGEDLADAVDMEFEFIEEE